VYTYQLDAKEECKDFINKFDLILMNPPFGTKEEGVDIKIIMQCRKYLKRGGRMYSFHKSCTVEVHE